MPQISRMPLHLALAVAVVVLIAALPSDTHLTSPASSFGIAPVFAATASKPDAENNVAAAARLSSTYGRLPISFEVNQGQTAGVVQYLAHGEGYTLFLAPGEAVLMLGASQPAARNPHGSAFRSAIISPPAEGAEKSAAVHMQLAGSNKNAAAVGLDSLPGKSNYFIGSDPAKWHTDIPTYAKVRYHDVYPGIDLVYYGNQEGRLEHDFVVAPGADPHRIEFDLHDGDRTLALNDGELNLPTRAGDLKLRAPIAYQVIGGEKTLVAASYQAADSGHIRFRVGSYDSHHPLIIDPVLVYSAVFGGSYLDFVHGIAIDTAQNVYVTGNTYSTDFPLADPYQSAPGFFFVSKLNSSGTALVYSTYLGGEPPNYSEGLALAVDAGGRAYVSGQTAGGLPIVHAYQPTYGGTFDAFITVLNAAGNGVEWSTYLGGPNYDYAQAMALDSSGNVYVTGSTQGPFPELHSIPCRGFCIWVAKFNSAGALQYSTFDGAGSSQAIAADSSGSAYITGVAHEPVATTPGAFRSTCAPSGCGFVAKLSPTGDRLVYATTLGAITATGSAIAVDSDGNAYIGGAAGQGLPVWSSGFQHTFAGGSVDGMVIKLNATGTNLIWSTYLGGSGDDYIESLALDRYRQVYVAGYTSSPDFPLKSPIQGYTGTNAAPNQVFVTTLSSSLSSIQYYSTYFGSETSSDPYFAGNKIEVRLAVDPALNVYLAGTDRNTVQPTPGAYSVGSSAMASTSKAFISKLTIMDDLSLALSASRAPVAHGSDLTYTIGVTSNGPDFGVNVRVSDTVPSGTTFVGYDAGSGTCTGPPVGSTGTLNCRIPQLGKGATWNVKLTVQVNAAPGSKLSNTAATISNMQDFMPGNNSSTITTTVN